MVPARAITGAGFGAQLFDRAQQRLVAGADGRRRCRASAAYRAAARRYAATAPRCVWHLVPTTSRLARFHRPTAGRARSHRSRAAFSAAAPAPFGDVPPRSVRAPWRVQRDGMVRRRLRAMGASPALRAVRELPAGPDGLRPVAGSGIAPALHPTGDDGSRLTGASIAAIGDPPYPGTGPCACRLARPGGDRIACAARNDTRLAPRADRAPGSRGQKLGAAAVVFAMRTRRGSRP